MSKNRTILIAAAGILAVVTLRRGTRGRRAARRLRHQTSRRARYIGGRLRGVAYRLLRRHPSEDVSDLVLRDRIRSALGPVEQRLDIPRIHVMVQDGVAILHGAVDGDDNCAALEEAVNEIAGVEGIESYLETTLLPGDTRPSEGHETPQRSDARRRLDAAARRAGAGDLASRAVRAVLASFFERLPAGEREHVLTHLPADVQDLATPPHRVGAGTKRMRTVDDLVSTVVAADPNAASADAMRMTESVLVELRALVPEERADIAAVLPQELREFWERADNK